MGERLKETEVEEEEEREEVFGERGVRGEISWEGNVEEEDVKF